MNVVATLVNYFAWHYGLAFKDILRVWTNYLWFILHTFSFKILFQTFFSPFRRLQEERPEKFRLGEWAQRVTINIAMRIVGMIMRTMLLAVGTIVFAITLVGGIVFYVLWIAWPAVAIYLIIEGMNLL